MVDTLPLMKGTVCIITNWIAYGLLWNTKITSTISAKFRCMWQNWILHQVIKLDFVTDRKLLCSNVTGIVYLWHRLLFLGEDKLEIRTGNSSQAPVVRFFDIANLTAHELVSKDGFYVRLQVTCSAAKHFSAVFTSFLVSAEEGTNEKWIFRPCNVWLA